MCVRMGSYIALCSLLALTQEFRRKFDVPTAGAALAILRSALAEFAAVGLVRVPDNSTRVCHAFSTKCAIAHYVRDTHAQT